MGEILLNTPVAEIHRIGKTLSKRLEYLGIKTLEELLYYFPFRYEDYRDISPIVSVQPGSKVTIHGVINEIVQRRGFKSVRHITEALVSDETGTIRVIWFNQPYLVEVLKKGERLSLSGRVNLYNAVLSLVNPVYEKELAEQQVNLNTRCISPVYSLTANITQKQLRFLVHEALKQSETFIVDHLPEAVKAKMQLISLERALWQIHFPEDEKALKAAQRRLKFDELFFLQMQHALLRKKQKTSQAFQMPCELSHIKTFLNRLPFALTNAQKKVAWSILQDLEKPYPMNRLLQGDVGSGKTVVSAVALFQAAMQGYQGCLMVPTEILARQHFNLLAELFAPFSLQVVLLTKSASEVSGVNGKGEDKKTPPNPPQGGMFYSCPHQEGGQSSPSPLRGIKGVLSIPRSELKKAISSGAVQIVIGTHALLQQDVQFSRLGLVVVDEQHRFGVMQRKMLKEKIEDKTQDAQQFPHLLSMTATPIPRTLALTLYGDLSISVIDEMPRGRKPIVTSIIASAQRESMYQFMKEQIMAHRQIYVICPLIEESDVLGVISVKQEYERLQEVFQGFALSMLHGKMRASEKEEIMEQFKQGKTHILVTTSVVEVGVDVPNATVMCIEGAERFGLAQLHQFRGRVGRSGYQSYCFLCAENASPMTYRRLQALVLCHDGLKLAELDLQLRGPGEIFGKRQSGVGDLKLASLSEGELIALSSALVEEILQEDSELVNYPVLREKLAEKLERVHLE